MHRARKGQQRTFGMKMHIGADSRSGLAHSTVVTSANVRDKNPLPNLLRGNGRGVHGDSACSSLQDLIASKAPEAKDFTNVRYRGWAKNATRAFTALALANIFVARGPLMAQLRP